MVDLLFLVEGWKKKEGGKKMLAEGPWARCIFFCAARHSDELDGGQPMELLENWWVWWFFSGLTTAR